MKKLVSKLKKIPVLVSIFCISIYTKVFAVYSDSIVHVVPAYGIEKPKTSSSTLLDILAKSLLFVPILFIIGAVIYFKKSAVTTSKKIKRILIALAIVVVIYLGILLVIEYFK